MRFEFTAGMVTGLLLGGALATLWLVSRPEKATVAAASLDADAGIEDFMFPDAKLEDIYQLPWIQELLTKPSGATIHLRSSEGSIHYGDFRFASEGAAVAADEIAPLSRTLRAMNAYQVGLGLACLYNPGAMLRIEGGGHNIDFLICFQCRVADWYADGRHVDQSIAPRVGFSDLGFRVLRRIITKVYPDKLHLSEALRTEPTGERNGCRQRLGWHLSCHRRLPAPAGVDSLAPARVALRVRLRRISPAATVAAGGALRVAFGKRCRSAPFPLAVA